MIATRLSRLLTLVAGVAGAGHASAQTLEFAGATLTRIRIGAADTYVGTTVQPPGTCSNYGEYFHFDQTTASGKSWLAALFLAKATGAPIDIWYTQSSAPGTNESSGCTGAAVSVVIGVGPK